MQYMYFNGNTGETAYLLPPGSGDKTKYTITFIGKKGIKFATIESVYRWLSCHGFTVITK